MKPFRAAALLIIVACGTEGGSGPLASGIWGGPQGNLTVRPDSATLDLPCAIGLIPHPIVASGGDFTVEGGYAVQAGPVFQNGPDWQPASFHGVLSGDDLKLTIALSQGSTVGPLQLHHGTAGQFARCE